MTVSRQRLVSDLSQLVRIPSHLECDTIGKHVRQKLKEIGLADVHVDAAGNVIAVLGKNAKGPGLLVNAHMDTVPPGDFVGDPFSGKVVKGRLLGRGSGDDKGGIATMFEIARILKDRPLKGPLTLAFSVWEESTAHGENGSYLIAKECGAKRCITLESTMTPDGSRMAVLIGCKGIMNLNITVLGKACHAAKPHEGVNAVSRAADVIREFEKVFAVKTMPHKTYELWPGKMELSDLATITEIEARQGSNVLPGVCEIVANCRLLPDGDETEILRRMKQLEKQLPKGCIAWKAQRKILGHLCEDREMIVACREAIKETGLRTGTEIMHGRADSTIFQNVGGIQSVIMGPGCIASAHTKDESIAVKDLVAGTKAILRSVEKLVAM